MASTASRELDSMAVYYKLLNSSIRLAATGGTDNFSDVWFDPSGGATRTYAYTGVSNNLDFVEWVSAVAAGRTFATSGPLLFLRVNGETPGNELLIPADQAANLDITVQARSIVPLERVELVVNGEVAERWGDRGLGI